MGAPTRCSDPDRARWWIGWPAELEFIFPAGTAKVYAAIDNATEGQRALQLGSSLYSADVQIPAGLANSELLLQAKQFAARAKKQLFDGTMSVTREPEVEQFSRYWFVNWPRTAGSYLFERDHVAVLVQPFGDTWRLLSYDHWHVHPDDLVRPEAIAAQDKLSREEAIRHGRAAALVEGADVGLGGGGGMVSDEDRGRKLVPAKQPLLVNLRIIPYQLDGRRARGGFDCGAKEDFTKPVLAWGVRFQMHTATWFGGIGKDTHHWWHVWISAADGSVVGCGWSM